MNVSFQISKPDLALVKLVCERAVAQGHARGKAAPKHWYRRQCMTIDLIATHANGCPMDFQRLLDANAFNFLHDVAGIAKFVNRETGKLDGHFRPRFARRDADAAQAA